MAKEKKDEERLVSVMIPFTDNEDDTDVFVSINERTWQIQRGEYVDVPECVALLLREMDAEIRKVQQRKRKLVKNN